MPGSNNAEIKFNIFNEEIEILKKDSKNVEKGHTRRLKNVIRSQDQPTILLSKKGDVKEKVTFIDVKEVTEVRSGKSTDLIQLVCSNGENVMLRVKSSGDSRRRWLEFLKTCLPERNPQRGRSSTMDQDLRGQHSRTWRRNQHTQSEYNPDVTVLERPIPNVLNSLPENDYEVLRHDQTPPLRSMEQSLSQDDDTASASGSRFNINYNINIRISEPPPAPSSTTPTPPPRVGSQVARPQRSASTSHRCHVPDVRNDLVTELKSVVKEIIPGQNEPTVPKRAAERSRRPSLLEAHQETEGEDETIYDNEDACLRSGTAAVARRNLPVPAVRQHNNMSRFEIENQTTGSADSSSSDEDDKSPYINVETNVYLRNLRQDLRDEMERESVSRTVPKAILLDLQMVDTSGEVCISCVPAGLDRLFYHGDRIIGINDQRIIDARFARAIIETSKKDKIKVTVKRLVRGHFVELRRQNEGDPLGFSLKNGPEILRITPGTVFARSANCALVERMAISHINGKYIPLDSDKQHVNMCIRNAGFSFFIILQPVTFLKELMQAN